MPSSAETMAFEISLDLESPAYEDIHYVGGLSYDFKKAFDLIPIDIMLATLSKQDFMLP